MSIDLVERYGSSVLWGDGHWGHGPDHWRTREFLERIWSIDPDVVLNDRWRAADGDGPAGRPDTVRTFEYEAPADIVTEPWELCRGLGFELLPQPCRAGRTPSLRSRDRRVADRGRRQGRTPSARHRPEPPMGRFRNCRPNRYATPDDGSAGTDRCSNTSTPWTTWGDEHVRYLDVGGTLHAVDLDGHAHFAALGSDRCRVESVELVGTVPGDLEPLRFHQDDDGHCTSICPRVITDRRERRVDDVSVYRVVCSDVERPDTLFLPEPREPIALAPLMRDVSPGDIVQLGDGVYTGPVGGSAWCGDPRTRWSPHGDRRWGHDRRHARGTARLEHLTVRAGRPELPGSRPRPSRSPGRRRRYSGVGSTAMWLCEPVTY